MSPPHRITVAHGDGIGPEIMRATLDVLRAARVPLEFDAIEVGEAVYRAGVTSGIPPDAWDVIRRNGTLLKAPITTPQGGGYKSLNVTIRKTLNLFANVRPCKAYTPFVASPHPGMNVVIVRENEEDLYAGIEYRHTQDSVQALKIVSRTGCERITRYAFEYARAYGRRKVTCMTKDNILKMTDGLLHAVFDDVAREYPDIKADHQIIDIGAANVAARPEMLDVIVTLNLYGDILSDIAAQVAGSVGLAGSANVGEEHAMFEAIHGSAPDIAGKDVANPSGLLVAATQMLVHVGLADHAAHIANAWLCAIEDGVHTMDIYRHRPGEQQVGTRAFADAVIERLGRVPEQLEPARFHGGAVRVALAPRTYERKELAGVDVFVDAANADARTLGAQIGALGGDGLALAMITNGGVKVYPGDVGDAHCGDQWRCRFTGEGLTPHDVLRVITRVVDAGFDVGKTENLYSFDGVRGYSLGHGE